MSAQPNSQRVETDPQFEWMDLRALTRYAAISERTLRSWIHDPIRPLPAYQVGSKLLVRRREFDHYVQQHPVRAGEAVGKIVDEILAEVTTGD